MYPNHSKPLTGWQAIGQILAIITAIVMYFVVP